MTKHLPIKIGLRAAQQIRKASVWWRDNRPAAPGAVREELEKAFELIRVQPNIGATAANVRLAGVRRVYLSRIGYHLYYQVSSSPPQVEVLALWHSSRGSAPNL